MKIKKILGLLFILFWVGVSLLIIYVTLKSIYNGFITFSYKETTGIINSSEIVSKYSSRDHKMLYAPKISFSYYIDSNKYFGNKINYAGEIYSSSKYSAELYLKKYPVGKNVSIFYNPRDYSKSVLEREVPLSSFGFFGIGMLFLVITVIMLVNYSKKQFKLGFSSNHNEKSNSRDEES